jgi:hypothetical protein
MQSTVTESITQQQLGETFWMNQHVQHVEGLILNEVGCPWHQRASQLSGSLI